MNIWPDSSSDVGAFVNLTNSIITKNATGIGGNEIIPTLIILKFSFYILFSGIIGTKV